MFAEALAKLGDLYVNDAFGAAHRAHASTAGITKFVAQVRDGFSDGERVEISARGTGETGEAVRRHPGRRESFGQNRRDQGADGKGRYDSDRRRDGEHVLESARNSGREKPVEADKLDLARELLTLAKEKGINFLLPVDALEAQEIRRGRADTKHRRASQPNTESTDGWQAVDIGRATIALFEEEIAKAKTILWNGPLGHFRDSGFCRWNICDRGSAGASRDATTIIGGGDSVTAVKQAGLGGQDDFHLHRRRRVARIARRERAARRAA